MNRVSGIEIPRLFFPRPIYYCQYPQFQNPNYLGPCHEKKIRFLFAMHCPDKVKTSFHNWILESYLTFVLNPQSSIVLWLDETKWKMCLIVILHRCLELVSSEVAKLGMRWNLKWVQFIKMNDYSIINLYESCLHLRNIILSLDLHTLLDFGVKFLKIFHGWWVGVQKE